MVNLEELGCGCCYELLVDPTTLTCGHSFCRYCLAKWYCLSKKTECPECRQTWTGFPKVNVHLRTIVEKSFPVEAADRKTSQSQSGDYKEILKNFEALGQGEAKGQQIPNVDAQQVQAIIGLVFLAIIVVLVLASLSILYYVFLSGPRTSEAVFTKSADKWTGSEVELWVHTLTPQLKQDYSLQFFEAGVTGPILLALTEDHLANSPLNIANALHRKILAKEISKLNFTRVKEPTDLFEYKKANIGTALFLLLMLQDNPRLTFAYLHYMEYHSIFLPLLLKVIRQENSDKAWQDFVIEDGVTKDDLFKFYLRAFLFPYYIMMQFSWAYVDVHFITSWVVIAHCVMLTVGELAQLPRLIPPIRQIPRATISCIVSYVITCIWFWTLISFTPSFICDIVFYAKLYYGPIETAGNIRKGNIRVSIVGNILNGVVTTAASVLRIFRFFLNPRN